MPINPEMIVEILTLLMQGADALTKSIATANAGDKSVALLHLTQARQHFDSAAAKWAAAGKAEDNGAKETQGSQGGQDGDGADQKGLSPDKAGTGEGQKEASVNHPAT